MSNTTLILGTENFPRCEAAEQVFSMGELVGQIGENLDFISLIRLSRTCSFFHDTFHPTIEYLKGRVTSVPAAYPRIERIGLSGEIRGLLLKRLAHLKAGDVGSFLQFCSAPVVHGLLVECEAQNNAELAAVRIKRVQGVLQGIGLDQTESLAESGGKAEELDRLLEFCKEINLSSQENNESRVHLLEFTGWVASQLLKSGRREDFDELVSVVLSHLDAWVIEAEYSIHRLLVAAKFVHILTTLDCPGLFERLLQFPVAKSAWNLKTRWLDLSKTMREGAEAHPEILASERCDMGKADFEKMLEITRLADRTGNAEDVEQILQEVGELTERPLFQSISARLAYEKKRGLVLSGSDPWEFAEVRVTNRAKIAGIACAAFALIGMVWNHKHVLRVLAEWAGR